MVYLAFFVKQIWKHPKMCVRERGVVLINPLIHLEHWQMQGQLSWPLIQRKRKTSLIAVNVRDGLDVEGYNFC